MEYVLMELRHLRYFVVTAEELHFTRAAQRIGIAQPPLTYQIKMLERELGVRLFERQPGNVRLTEAGKALLEDAREILDRVGKAATRCKQRARRGWWAGSASALRSPLPSARK